MILHTVDIGIPVSEDKTQQPQAAGQVVRYGNKEFRSIESIERYLLHEVNEDEREKVMVNFRDQLLGLDEAISVATEKYFVMIEKHQRLQLVVENDPASWEEVRAVVKDRRTKQERVDRACDTIEGIWGTGWESRFGYERREIKFNLAEKLRLLARKAQDLTEARILIDQCVVLRRVRGGRDVSNAARIQLGDVERALQDTAGIPDKSLTPAQLNAAKLTYGPNGSLVDALTPAIGSGRATTVSAQTIPSITSITEESSTPAPTAHRGKSSSVSATHPPAQPSGHRRASSTQSTVSSNGKGGKSPGISPFRRSRNFDLEMSTMSLSTVDSDHLSSPPDDEFLVDLAIAAGLGDSMDALREVASETSRFRAAVDVDYEDEDDGLDATSVPADDHLKTERCVCADGVPRGLKNRLNASGRQDLAKSIKMLGEVLIADDAYLQKMGGKFGLQTRKLNAELMRERLQAIYDGRNNLGELKTGDNTYMWFRREARPPRQADSLGVYRLAPLDVPPFAPLQLDLTTASRALLRNELAERWEQDGSIITPPIFKHVFDSDIWPALKEELNMYRWHLRELSGRSNLGWLRNCEHSILQQLVRQDLTYYAMNVSASQKSMFIWRRLMQGQRT